MCKLKVSIWEVFDNTLKDSLADRRVCVCKVRVCTLLASLDSASKNKQKQKLQKSRIGRKGEWEDELKVKVAGEKETQQAGRDEVGEGQQDKEEEQTACR